MKGLILNNLYTSIGNIKLFSIMVFASAAAVLVTGNPTMQELFVYLTITVLSVNAVVSTRKDAVSNWNKFELTMPVRRKDIIKSKYLTYIFLLVSGTVFALVITVITMLIHGNSNFMYGMTNFYSMFVLGIEISLFTGALFFPIAYLAGIDKSETILIISLILSIGLVVFILNVLNQFIFGFAVRMTLFISLYIIFFACSYGLTLRIYLNKEL